ncbi:SDR family NAD(P)-dependent oxidoreductase [Patulibacter sp.]|uniref:SDR family NAD(P)-dependent oxidoreductase n=1 Tax=Patulibacter sp. TaxID=1912859 RepID=UPI002725ED21|nr:SDR family oxidoreductase [Patulibacter sp.]MDO9408290.1 SDR family oxidoreductase [Patulibacter sp.]
MTDALTLQNTTALITGATSGIGRETALLLAADGAHVVVTGRDADRGAETVAAIGAAGGTARFVAADLGDVDDVRRLASAVGEIDVLVNNAGLFPFAATADLDPATFDDTFAVNVRGAYFLTAAIAPGMAERGRGSIVNVTTMVDEFGLPGTAAYGASKAALVSLTRTWAAEFGPSGVRVNAVSPGPTRTEGTVAMGDGLDQLASTTPLGHPADAVEIARVIAFVASPRASYVHGAVVAADGGRTAV